MSNRKTIYVLLSDTGTLLSKLIKLYTRAPLNHASIAFDPELRELYSFGRKDQRNPFVGGFVREDVDGELFLGNPRRTNCAVYACDVDEPTYHRIRRQVERIEKREREYKYNLLGVISLAFGIGWRRKNTYFCFQFVCDMFEAGGVSLVDKPSVLATPCDLERSPSLRLIFRGELREYLEGIGRECRLLPGEPNLSTPHKAGVA